MKNIALAKESARYIVEKTKIRKYEIVLVLGSGWKQDIHLLGEEVKILDAGKIPGFSKSNISGHSGQISSIKIRHGKNAGKNALIIGSRKHFYEDKNVDSATHSIKTSALLGCKKIILTNGCGTTNINWTPGQVVLIKDHINNTGITPLYGANFVDLTNVYSKRIRNALKKVDPSLKEGVYIQFSGPNYETPAEIRMAKILGADLVGMSTVLEAITARAEGIEILGMSLITNMCSGITSQLLSHKEVLEVGKDSSIYTRKLLLYALEEI